MKLKLLFLLLLSSLFIIRPHQNSVRNISTQIIERSVCIDSSFSELKKEKIVYAVRLWKDFANVKYKFFVHDYVNKCDYYYMNAKSTDEVVSEFSELTLAMTNEICGNTVYMISDRIDILESLSIIDSKLFITVVAHEHGHLLGIEHQLTGLMTEKMSEPKKPSPADAALIICR